MSAQHTPRDFARIERASDGAQVLFYKGTNDAGKPALIQMTEFDGFYAELNIAFSDDDEGWDRLDSAFCSVSGAQADAVRASIAKAIGAA